MKKYSILFAVIYCMTACNSGRLDSKQALELILKDQPGSYTVTYEIWENDPVEAEKIMATDLDENGVVRIYAAGTTIPKDSAQINLTAKGASFLDHDSASAGKKNPVVKIAKATIVADPARIRMITENEGKTATAAYQLAFSEVTPFSVLLPQRNFTVPETKTARFQKKGDGWVLLK